MLHVGNIVWKLCSRNQRIGINVDPLFQILNLEGMREENTPNVVVVGAGPVGLATALSLHKRGVPLSIIERDDRPGTHSYALALYPATLKLLDRWGLGVKLREHGWPVRRLVFHDLQKPCFTLNLKDIPGHEDGLLVVGQDKLENVLVEPIERSGPSIAWSHRVANLKPDADGVEVEVERLVEGMSGYAMAHMEWHVDHTFAARTRFVVGADGHLSLVRRKSGIEFPKVGKTQSFAVFEFKTDYALDDSAHIVFDGEGTNVMWPLPGNYCRWSFEIDEESAEQFTRDKDRLFVQVGSQGYRALEERMLERFLSERAPWFSGSIERFRWRMIVRFEKRLASRFGDGRVWLAGDAAHLAGPVGMQSMNIGIREGVVLGETLADVLSKRLEPQSLDAYGKSRMDEWKVLSGRSVRLEAGKATDPFIEKFKDQLICCLPTSLEALPAFAKALGLELRPVS